MDKPEKITTFYWYGDHSSELFIPHNYSYPYSKELRDGLVDKILEKGYEVMLRKVKDCLIIYIDNAGGRFRQR